MMKKVFLILLIALSCSQNGDNQQKPVLDTVKPEVVNQEPEIEELLSFTISRKENNYEISTNNDYKFPKELVAQLNKSIVDCDYCYNKLLQDSTMTVNTYDPFPFDIQDVNFDGKMDLRIPSLETCCSGNNVVYFTWIYDSTINNYKFNKELSELPILKLYATNKTVEGGWIRGLNDFNKVEFKWMEDVLVMEKEVISETINDSTALIVTRTLNDKIWSTDSTTIEF
ncbi:MAG: hypothetical protein NXI20_00575 [bacterium]|nr:hypothetical protein [bacterium]